MPNPRHPADSNRHNANRPTKLRRFQLRSDGEALSTSFGASNRAVGGRDDGPGRDTFEMDVSAGSAEATTTPDIGTVANECSFRLSLACQAAVVAAEFKIELGPSLERGPVPGRPLGSNSSRVFLAKSSPWVALEPGSSRFRDPFAFSVLLSLGTTTSERCGELSILSLGKPTVGSRLRYFRSPLSGEFGERGRSIGREAIELDSKLGCLHSVRSDSTFSKSGAAVSIAGSSPAKIAAKSTGATRSSAGMESEVLPGWAAARGFPPARSIPAGIDDHSETKFVHLSERAFARDDGGSGAEGGV